MPGGNSRFEPFTHGVMGGTDQFVKEGKIYVEFFHLVSSETIAFKGYLTNFADSYDPKFNSVEVYGRMDPIAIYQGTSRKISLAWTVVAESYREAWENWRNIQNYVRMLYPAYKNIKTLNPKKGGRIQSVTATALSAPPLLKMKFMNLAASAKEVKTLKKNTKKRSLSFSYKGGTARSHGLLVVPGSIQVQPQIDDGFLLPKDLADQGDVIALPRTIQLSSEYVVLHEHDLGYHSTRVMKGAKAPYLKEAKIAKKAARSAAAGTKTTTINYDFEAWKRDDRKAHDAFTKAHDRWSQKWAMINRLALTGAITWQQHAGQMKSLGPKPSIHVAMPGKYISKKIVRVKAKSQITGKIPVSTPNQSGGTKKIEDHFDNFPYGLKNQ